MSRSSRRETAIFPYLGTCVLPGARQGPSYSMEDAFLAVVTLSSWSHIDPSGSRRLVVPFLYQLVYLDRLAFATRFPCNCSSARSPNGILLKSAEPCIFGQSQCLAALNVQSRSSADAGLFQIVLLLFDRCVLTQPSVCLELGGSQKGAPQGSGRLNEDPNVSS